MDALRAALAANPQAQLSPEVQNLLACLQHSAFQLDVQICSYGGVGSTELGNFLTRHGLSTNLLRDTDGMRHCNRPPSHPIDSSAPRCVVYLFGDPLASVASHYRRGQAYHQALKTSGNPRLREAEFPATLEDYVDRGEDLFGYRAHLLNWLTEETTYPVLFVRYEAMFDPDVALAMLSHLCGHKKPSDQVAAMAQELSASRRTRQSEVSDELRSSGMYAELQAEIDSLPRLFVRTESCGIQPLC